MGLLDNELNSIKSEYTRKPEWALCKYCRVPFLTSTFEETCQRCKHFINHDIEITSKLMLMYILFAIASSVINVVLILFLIKYTKNYAYLLSALTISNTLQGLFLWKIVKKILIT